MNLVVRSKCSHLPCLPNDLLPTLVKSMSFPDRRRNVQVSLAYVGRNTCLLLAKSMTSRSPGMVNSIGTLRLSMTIDLVSCVGPTRRRLGYATVEFARPVGLAMLSVM